MGGNGNGKVKDITPATKTPEQLKEERLKRYQAHPESFVEVKDLICAAVINLKAGLGLSVMVGNVPRTLIDIAQIELTHRLNRIRMQMDVQSEMKHQIGKNIVQPGAMRKFAGKIMGRRH